MAGPSKSSKARKHVSNPRGSAGKAAEMGAMELQLRLSPGPDPSEQHRHVAKGSIARMRCCKASYCHMLHVPNPSHPEAKRKKKKKATTA